MDDLHLSRRGQRTALATSANPDSAASVHLPPIIGPGYRYGQGHVLGDASSGAATSPHGGIGGDSDLYHGSRLSTKSTRTASLPGRLDHAGASQSSQSSLLSRQSSPVPEQLSSQSSRLDHARALTRSWIKQLQSSILERAGGAVPVPPPTPLSPATSSKRPLGTYPHRLERQHLPRGQETEGSSTAALPPPQEAGTPRPKNPHPPIMPRACSETLISDTIFDASWRTGPRARAGPPVRGGTMVMSTGRRGHEIPGAISGGASRSSGSSVPATYRSAGSQEATALTSDYIETASIGSCSSASLPATYRSSSDSQDTTSLPSEWDGIDAAGRQSLRGVNSAQSLLARRFQRLADTALARRVRAFETAFAMKRASARRRRGRPRCGPSPRWAPGPRQDSGPRRNMDQQHGTVLANTLEPEDPPVGALNDAGGRGGTVDRTVFVGTGDEGHMITCRCECSSVSAGDPNRQ